MFNKIIVIDSNGDQYSFVERPGREENFLAIDFAEGSIEIRPSEYTGDGILCIERTASFLNPRRCDVIKTHSIL